MKFVFLENFLQISIEKLLEEYRSEESKIEHRVT